MSVLLFFLPLPEKGQGLLKREGKYRERAKFSYYPGLVN